MGKTSLAKRGIAQCLKDQNGNARPFSFIPIEARQTQYPRRTQLYIRRFNLGSNRRYCHGKQGMNPIIFIDELDKVSTIEHGKEQSVYLHLVDPHRMTLLTTNISVESICDLSKALFIFS